MDSLEEKHLLEEDKPEVSEEEKEVDPEKKAVGDKVVRFTFYITYAFLMTYRYYHFY